MRDIKIGLIGAGWMGKVHAMSYRMAESAFGPEPARPVLEVIADVDAGLAERAARDYGFNRSAADWRQVVDDPGIDLIDICTPNDLHFDIAMAAIAAGKHVYCEKPLANSADLALQMTEAAERKGVTTLLGFNYIQNPVHGLAKKIIARGEIGDVDYVRLFFNGDFMADRNLPHTWRNDAARAGTGVIGDLGAHCLSYFYRLLDREIVEVFCNLDYVVKDRPAPTAIGGFKLGARGDAGRRIANTTDDAATVIFKLAGGGSGHIEVSRIATGVRFEIGYDIVGSKGTLRYDYRDINDLFLYREDEPAEERGFKRIKMGPTDPRFLALHPVSGLGLGYNDYKAIEAREIVAAIGEGRKASPDFRFGYRIQHVVDACVRAHESRQWVQV
jgi:predicted dehydrogenase